MTLGSHQTTVGRSQSWITPRWILDAVGPFDLDPAGASPRPWSCAGTTWTEANLATHGHGTALLHARVEAEWFEPAWQSATAILFLADRIFFHYPDGRRAEANSGAPACLIAFGAYDAERLRSSRIRGYLITDWEEQLNPAEVVALQAINAQSESPAPPRSGAFTDQ
jgi:hypothetical protein